MTLVNDDLLIDFGPDLHAAATNLRLNLDTVRYGLQTHPHSDHLHMVTFFSRTSVAPDAAPETLQYVCGKSTGERLNYWLFEGDTTGQSLRDPDVQEKYRLRITEIEPWQEVRLGDEYRVQSVTATHNAPGVEPMVYIKELATGSQVFYGSDTGTLTDGTWGRLAAGGWRFGVFVLEHSFGVAPRPDYPYHMDPRTFLAEIGRAREAGVLTREKNIYATHLSHLGHTTHERFSEQVEPHGYEIGHDGMTVNVPSLIREDAAVEPTLVTTELSSAARNLLRG